MTTKETLKPVPKRALALVADQRTRAARIDDAIAEVLRLFEEAKEPAAELNELLRRLAGNVGLHAADAPEFDPNDLADQYLFGRGRIEPRFVLIAERKLAGLARYVESCVIEESTPPPAA